MGHRKQQRSHQQKRRSHGKARPSALLLTLVARAARGWWSWWQAQVQALRQWRERRRAAAHARQHDAVGIYRGFETLEPRLLLSADLQVATSGSAVPQVNTSQVIQKVLDNSALQAAAVSATPAASLSIHGPGTGTLQEANGIYSLKLEGTTALTQVTLDVSGLSHITLGHIEVSGHIGALDLGLADLAGDASFGGNVGSLVLGSVTGSTLQVAGSGTLDVKADAVLNSSLKAQSAAVSVDALSWTGADSLIEARTLKSLNVLHDFSAGVSVSGLGATDYALNTVTIGGQVTGGVWAIHGRTKSVSLGSSTADWHANFAGALVQLSSRGDLGGQVSLAGVQTVQVGGSARSLKLLVGADLGNDASLGGSGANADTFKAGTLARLRISGDLIDSDIQAGIDPVNGVYGDGDDAQLGNSTKQPIQELVIGGAIRNSHVVAPAYPAAVRVGGVSQPPSALPALLLNALPDTVAPVLTAALVQDTGAHTDDGVTSKADIRIVASDASGALTFDAKVDGGNFEAIAPVAQADGSWLWTGASALADGPHAIQLRARDAAGNVSAASTVSFTLLRAAPSATLSLDAAFDTGTAGDRETSASPVSIVVQTQ
ncbi:MAG: hypothetical protein RI920_1997, partial [Pseudomonadota bacterium]